jgi:signal transduction histidine kinase
MKKWSLFLMVFLCSVYYSSAQNDYIDSLASSLSTIPNDTVKARTYIAIHNALIGYNDSLAIHYNREALQHVKKMNWKKGEAVFLGNIGENYSNQGIYDSAITYFTKAQYINQKIKEYYNLVGNLINKGTAEVNIKSNYNRATEYFFEALDIAEKQSVEKQKPVLYLNIAGVFLEQSNYQKCILYTSDGIRVSSQLGDSVFIAKFYITLSKCHYKLNDFAQAKSYAIKAIEIYTSAELQLELAEAYSSLALATASNMDSVIMLRRKAKELFELGYTSHPNALVNQGNLAVALFDIVRYDSLTSRKLSTKEKNQSIAEAKQLLNQTIKDANDIENYGESNYYTGILAELQAYLGDYKNAYLNFRLYQQYNDSVYSQEQKNKLAELESKRTIDAKNQEIQRKKNSLTWRNYVLVLLGFTAMILIFFIRTLSKRSKEREAFNQALVELNTELDKSNQMKSKFLSIISHDFRAPIARLISFLSIQKEMPDAMNEQEKKNVQENITKSATALLANMESILQWSKSNLTQFALAMQDINLLEFLSNCKERHILRSNISIECKSDITLLTDTNVLKIILDNLLLNSEKALKNHPHPEIKWIVSKDEEKISLTHKDNGPGFNEAFLTQNKSKNINLESSGYGWHIIHDMADLLQLQILVYNDQGAVVKMIWNNTSK